jgi:hypothetical protein
MGIDISLDHEFPRLSVQCTKIPCLFLWKDGQPNAQSWNQPGEEMLTWSFVHHNEPGIRIP